MWRTVLHRSGLERFSILYLWAGFVLLFGILSPNIFFTITTVHSVASEQAVAGILAVAVLVPIACGNYDLSVGANANLTGIVAMELQTRAHWGVASALVASLALGVLIGVCNGFIVVKLGVSSFIGTLGMGSVLSAFLVIVTGSNLPEAVTSSAWNNLTQRQVGGFQVIIVYVVIVGLLAWWLLDYTPFGRYLFAMGDNADAARLSGVRVQRWSWLSLVISGGVAGLGGILYSSLNGPSLTFGSTLLLPAFAAVFLGSTQFRPGRFNIWGALVSICVLATGVQGLQFVSGEQWLGDMFNGVALIGAVSLAVAREGGTGRAPTGEAQNAGRQEDFEPADRPPGAVDSHGAHGGGVGVAMRSSPKPTNGTA
jgi:ribose transport system permease protein